MSRREALLVAILAALAIAAVAIPLHAAHRAAAEAGDVWTGQFPSRDHAQYAALAATAGRHPGILIPNPYDEAPRDPSILALPLSAAGLVARLTGASVCVLLAGLGLLAAGILPLTVHSLLRRLYRTPSRRGSGLVVLLFSGGLAFFHIRAESLWNIGRDWPSDAAFDEGWSVLGALHNPLWAVALVLCFATLSAALAADVDPSPRRLVTLALLASLLEPTHLYLGGGTLLVLWGFALTGRARGRLTAALLPATVLVALHAVRVLSCGAAEPGVGALRWIAPRPEALIGGYGALVPLALAGAAIRFRRPGPARRLLMCWLGAGVVLVANPLVAGVKFVTFLQPALALLAVDALVALASSRARLARPALMALGLVLVSAAPQVVRQQVRVAVVGTDCRLAPGEREALAFLAITPAGPVLAAPEVGTRLPIHVDRIPWLGHWFLTPDWSDRIDAVRAAFSTDASAGSRRRLLDDAGVSVVLVRNRDRDLLAAPPPPPFAEVRRFDACSVWIRGEP